MADKFWLWCEAPLTDFTIAQTKCAQDLFPSEEAYPNRALDFKTKHKVQ
jgi:hypothetical protein